MVLNPHNAAEFQTTQGYGCESTSLWPAIAWRALLADVPRQPPRESLAIVLVQVKP